MWQQKKCKHRIILTIYSKLILKKSYKKSYIEIILNVLTIIH